MSTPAATVSAAPLDLPQVAPHESHALVFARFDALRNGESMLLVDDHDPQPLRGQLQARSAGQFEWTALEAGPAAWRIRITRTAARPVPASGDSCCSGGACCG